MKNQIAPRSLETRIRRLELANRGLLAGALLAAGSLALMGAGQSQAVAELVQARSIEVVDESGRVQARLAATAEGVEMQFLDAAGVARVSLEHEGDDTGLFIKDSQGTVRIGVAQFAHGGGGLALHGEESKGGAVLYLKASKGSLTFYEGDGKIISRLPSEP